MDEKFQNELIRQLEAINEHALQGPGLWDKALVLVLLVSVIVAGLSVYRQNKHAELVAKRRAALDFWSRLLVDPQHNRNISILKELKNEELLYDRNYLKKLMEQNTERHKLEHDSLRELLNTYELLATSINMKVIDDEFSYRLASPQVTTHWKWAKPFIDYTQERFDRTDIYNELESVIRTWQERRQSRTSPRRTRWPWQRRFSN